MGTFGSYTGSMKIAEEKKEAFGRQVAKILNYGGMMQFEQISMYGHELGLLKPIELDPEGKVHFHYNYFEDDGWETAGFNAEESYFWSEKIGSAEFCDVVTAVHMLYELYDEGPGYAEVNGDVIGSRFYVGWLNSLLGTDFSMKKRFRLWKNFESYALSRVGDYDDPPSGVLMDMIPAGLRYAACGVEFADLMNIMEGTEMLTEDEVVPGTYPADVYGCKKAVEAFLKADPGRENVRRIWELLQKDKAEREQTEEEGLADIAGFSLFLPARVIVYLTTEKKKISFWETWKELRGSVYQDEAMKKYASDELEEERRELIEAPVPPVRTSEFLRQDGWFTFHDTPKELKGKPNYYISDDDRLYWWDGSDEVIISEETDQWLKGLAQRHKDIIDHMDEAGSGQDFMKGFLSLFADIDQFYQRIFPFQSMFYDFLQNSGKREYRAALELLKEIADENKEEGKIIEKAKYSWDITSRNVTHNIGRMRLKRYLAAMANKKLREKYFGF